MRAMQGRARRTGGLAIIGALLLSIPVLPVAGQERANGFTADERERLEHGQLVARPVTRRRGSLRLIGGSSWQVVDQPLDVTWRALCDARSYRRMLPGADEANVVAHEPGQRIVRVSHAVGFVHASYHLRMSYDHDRHDISFRLDDRRPNDLRAAWGFISISRYQDDPSRTLVSYGVMADVGDGMLGGILRGQIHEWMLRVPTTIRDYLRGPAQRRYLDG